MSFRAPLDADWPTILEIANASVAEVAGVPPQDEWLQNRRAFGARGQQDHFVLTEQGRVVGYGSMERTLQDPANGYRLFVVADADQLNVTGRKIHEQLDARLRAVGATDSWFIEYAQANNLVAFIRAQGYAELRRFTLASGETAMVLARKHSEAAMPNNDQSADRYVGVWILAPDLCLYEQGECPASGRYEISQAAGRVQIAISWRARDGSDHEVAFGSPNDGSRTDSNTPGTSHLSITRVNESILDSRAFLGEKEIAYARRSASFDGQLLSTVQVGYRADGSSFRNFQVYRRDESGRA